LSLSMLAAEQGYAVLAEAQGQQGEAEQARRSAEQLRGTIPERYWDAKTRFVYQGYTTAGRPVAQTRAPTGALTSDAFSKAQQEILMNRLLQPDFLTAWGIRSTPSTDPAYNPSSYATGSVWPIANAGALVALWEYHRDSAAFSIWNALVEATTMDAPGHIDEVLSGEEFRPLNVSVPEQTWSSAGFLSATVGGLLGYRADSASHVIRLAPHLPESWDRLGARLLPFGHDTVDVEVRRSGRQMTVRLVLRQPQPGAKYSVTLPDWCRTGERAATLEGTFSEDRRVTRSATCGGYGK
jgi:glycogen debranching enzyme